MPITCDCGKTHEAVPQAEFDKRVKTLTEQRSTLKTQLEEAQSAFDVKEIEALKADRAQLQTLRGEVEARDALEGAGFASSAKARRISRTLYEMAVEDTDASKRPSFADWLRDEKGAGAEPTLATFKTATAAAGADKSNPGKSNPGTARKPGLPNPNSGSRADVNGQMTPAQLQETLNRLPVGERIAKIKELGLEVPMPGRPVAAPPAEGAENAAP